MELQELLNKAWELNKDGDKSGALKLYDQAFNILTKEASDFAHKETSVSPLSNRITPDIFNESKKYLKRDKVASTVSNNMAVIFAELGDVETARKFFEQSIDLVPDGVDYPDPKIGLQELEK